MSTIDPVSLPQGTDPLSSLDTLGTVTGTTPSGTAPTTTISGADLYNLGATQKSPEAAQLFNAILQSFQSSILHDMKAAHDRRKKINDDEKRNNGG
ncbi:MAG: hypothetical protein JWO53_436 [Chlamydiia bacterium]|nr:hypothetical protein [Chlamydiia bacterium]